MHLFPNSSIKKKNLLSSSKVKPFQITRTFSMVDHSLRFNKKKQSLKSTKTISNHSMLNSPIFFRENSILQLNLNLHKKINNLKLNHMLRYKILSIKNSNLRKDKQKWFWFHFLKSTSNFHSIIQKVKMKIMNPLAWNFYLTSELDKKL